LPTIDIALPFYGDVAYLKLAVGSIRSQTDPQWRLLVSDDGYPDPHVREWFASLADDRIVYTRNDSNLGANGNFRKCLEMVTAEYVVVMGADDVMHPDYVSVVRHYLSSDANVAIVQPQVRIIDGHGKVIKPLADRIKARIRPASGRHSGEEICTGLMTGNWLYFPAVMWRTADVKAVGFRDGLNVAQDLGLAIDVLKRGEALLVIDEVLLDYRRHAGGDSTVRALSGNRFIEERAFFNQLSSEFESLGWSRAARAARRHITSRLNAASLLPASIRKRKGTGELLKHLVR
jgi:glycosyltransferase involved in cell wall biosynthesis